MQRRQTKYYGQTGANQPRRTRLLILADQTTAQLRQLDISGTVGEVLRHRQEHQPLIDCESSGEWSERMGDQ